MSTLSKVISNKQMLEITSEFSRLEGKCYLENTGATLYPQCLITSVNNDLMKKCYMNPHSDKYTKDCIDQIRSSILKHFNTDQSQYTVIFTSGCTESLKLVTESFQFATYLDDDSQCGSFVYLRDNHTSALGLREIAIEKHADIVHIAHDEFLTAISQKKFVKDDNYKNNSNTLLVYPAQSNFNGFKYPLDCIETIKKGCLNSYAKKQLCKINCQWYVMLDVASFVATNKLDLSKVQPDFVTLSFYKMFGYPTGLGALIVKNSSQHVLNQKNYFGGGTVDVVLSGEHFHVKRKNLCERFEDGTVSYLSIIALKHCFDTMNKLIPNVINNDIMETISYHTFYLAQDLYTQLSELRHPNGRKAVVLYMDSKFADQKKQGGVVTFNLLREDGSYIGYAEVQHIADLFNISLRTGCFCNSGSCQRHLKATNKEIKDIYKAGHTCGDDKDLINGKPTGAIRVSFGYYNTFKDVDKLMHMIYKSFVNIKEEIPKRMTLSFSRTKSFETKKTNGEVRQIFNQPDLLNNFIDNNMNNSEINLTEIAIFPIKSCGAFKIRSAWIIGPKGFLYDREWMIVRDNGVCLTQKQISRMCLIIPTIDPQQKLLTLNYEDKTPISIPLDRDSKMFRETSLCHSRVCTDTVKGYDCGDEVADWISEALEESFLRLIRQSDTDTRIQKKSNDNDKPMLSLSNQAQYLLINKATVRWLREKILDSQFADSVDALTDRFRGNLIIDMDTELVEREWNQVVIGKHKFKVEGLCSRCQMVCIDQQTGKKTVEPLRTIAEQFAGKLRFGIYLSYDGTVDDSKDRILKVNTSVKSFVNNNDISR